MGVKHFRNGAPRNLFFYCAVAVIVAAGFSSCNVLGSRNKSAVYSVSYNANGGTGTMENSVHEYGAAKNLNPNAFTRDGHAFTGWATRPDSDAEYLDGQSVLNLTRKKGAVITLYAKWDAKITFDSNGAVSGSVPPPRIARYISSITIPGQGGLTKPGYIFGGWYTDIQGIRTTYAAGSTYNLTDSVTMYAQWIETITSATGIEMVRIPAGTFEMGQAGVATPVHQVTLTNDYYMGVYEVTQEQYQAVMRNNPSYFNNLAAGGEVQGKRPVEMVSWYDALVFCNRLSIREGLTPAYRINNSTNPADWGVPPTSNNNTWNAVQIDANSNGYRLPTEAQWEYACRAGTTTAYNTGDTINDYIGWYSTNSNRRTHEVGKKLPNPWGLYDMHGNVMEWCWDWYGNYSSTAKIDPMGAPTGTNRVPRGGSWGLSATDLRSAYRTNGYPSFRLNSTGIRVVRPTNS